MNNICILILVTLIVVWLIYRSNKNNLINYINPKSVELAPSFPIHQREYLKTIQKELTQIFNDFNDICQENNLEYFALGGTLLGTLRHRGWIPFDDDIDVAMFPKDRKKLMDLMTTNPYYKNKYSYATNCKGEGPWLLNKILSKTDHKVWIDIMDIFDWGNDKYSLLRTNNKSRDYFSKSDIYPIKYGIFENIQMSIPNKPEKILEVDLGSTNFDMLPLDKRKPHHLPDISLKNANNPDLVKNCESYIK